MDINEFAGLCGICDDGFNNYMNASRKNNMDDISEEVFCGSCKCLKAIDRKKDRFGCESPNKTESQVRFADNWRFPNIYKWHEDR